MLGAVLADQTVASARSLFRKKEKPLLAADNEKALAAIRENDRHVLELSHIDKSFSGIPVLKDISLKIEGGRVHALMGENGAGKSTLIKIISGIYQKDGGTLSIDGIPVDIHSAADSQKLGIAVIYQEFALIPELNIAQNAFL